MAAEERDQRRREGRARRPLVLVAIACVAFVGISGLVALAVGGWHRRPAGADGFASLPHVQAELPKLWHARAFSLRDQHAASLTLQSLSGRPFVADFIFTQCTSACPMMTSKMILLQRRLRGRDVRFVSFSVDPAHDTPEVLTAYAMRWGTTDTRWSLGSTTPTSLADLTSGFRVAVEPSGDPKNPILHSNVFFLVDADGDVRGVYESMDPAAMAALAADAEGLSAPTAAPGAMPASSGLYASLGCGGCHDNRQIAPPLVDLRGGTRVLESDASVAVDDDYLRASILDPGRDRVAGYAVQMPSYRAQLTDAEVGALVGEIAARVADGGAASAAVRVVTDPVCGMKVRTEPDALHARVGGEDSYFCSEMCRDSFLEDPARYRPDASR